MHTYLIYWLSSIAVTPFLKNRGGNLLYFLFALLFVGARYETGFDWPTYKEYFSAVAGMNSLREVFEYAHLFGIEALFTIELWLFSFLVPSYEVFQFLITALYLYSFHSLATTLNLKRPAYALAITSTFLLLTLEFSTTRQLVAVAFFNLAINSHFKNRIYSTTAFLLLSILNQYSAIIYACCFLATMSKLLRAFILRNYPILISVFFIAGTTILVAITSYFPFFARKLLYYNEVGFQHTLSIRLLCIFAFIVFTIHFTALALKKNPTEKMQQIMSTLINLGILASGFTCTSVIRDRIFYELIILFGLVLVLQTNSITKFIRPGIAIAGIFYSTILYLKFPENLVFNPYQNSIFMTLTGSDPDSEARNQEYLKYFKDTYR